MKLTLITLLAAFGLITSVNAQSSSPAKTKGLAVSVDSKTYVQQFPVPLYAMRGFTTNGNSGYKTDGTNFFVGPSAPFQIIYATTNINLLLATNAVFGNPTILTNAGAVIGSTNTWETTIIIQPDAADHQLRVPVTWLTNTLSASAFPATVATATWGVLRIRHIGTNTLTDYNVLQ